MFQRQNLYEDPSQYRGINQGQSPMQSPTQPANSYTIDIAPTTYSLVPENRQMGQPAPTPQPTYNGYQMSLSQQQSPISPLSYTTSPSVVSPSMVSPPPQSNYVYQAAPPKGLPNLCGGVQQAPLASVPMPQAGLGMNYGQPPQHVDTTPRFSIPPPSNGMMSPQQPLASPYSPGYNASYHPPNQPNVGQPLMSPQTLNYPTQSPQQSTYPAQSPQQPTYPAQSPQQPTYAQSPQQPTYAAPQQPAYAAQPQQPVTFNQLNMY